MRLFVNVPTSKKTKAVGDRIMRFSHDLKCIIVSHQCVDFQKVNLGGLEYALFMYDLDCYREAMITKYSRFYIESTIRAIFLVIEGNLRKAGNNIADGYIFNMYVKLSNSLYQIFITAKKEGLDGFYAIAKYLCSDECGMNEEAIEKNAPLITEIANHFRKIANLPATDI